MATMPDSKARRTRRRFTDAYKTGAVRLVLDEGKTVAAAARDLGLTESSLRNWVEQARADRTKGKTGLTTEERTELAALRKDNRELHMERDILKKAAVSSKGRCNAGAGQSRSHAPEGVDGVSDVGPWDRIRLAQALHGRHEREGVLLRPAESMAARYEREHQRLVAAILPQRNKPLDLHAG